MLLRLMPKIDEILIDMAAILDEWRLCPSCHGKCGEFGKEYGGGWDDCERCDGRGVVEKVVHRSEKRDQDDPIVPTGTLPAAPVHAAGRDSRP